VEVCGVFGVLLGDQDGLYDPNDVNDRLVLGLKGTMSEVELSTMRNRLERGKLHKAERGELILTVPCGYLKLPHGEVILDPDEQVRATVQLVFDKFTELGSFGKVYRYLTRNKICAGTRAHQGPRRGELAWRPITRALLHRMLHHPIYAGAYSYGRRRVDPKRTAANAGKVRMQYVPMSEWKVLQRDRLPAYITWERYLANQQQLLANRSWPDAPGVPRRGAAARPAGLCGRRMHAGYRSKAKPHYEARRKLEGSRATDSAAAIDASGPAGSAGPGARRPGTSRAQRQTTRSGTPAPAVATAVGTVTQTRSAPNGNITRSNQRIASSPARSATLEEVLRAERAWSEDYDRFLHDQPRQPPTTNDPNRLANDIPSSGMLRRRRPPSARKSSAC
jgi:hypothetical protein